MTKRLLSSPIIAIAVAFMAGILTGHYLALPGSAVIVVSLLSLAGVVLSLRRRIRIAPVILSLVLWTSLGLLSYQVRYQRCGEDDIVRYSSDQPVLVRLQGQVLDDSYWAQSSRPWPSDPTLYFPIRVSRIYTRQGWTTAGGILRVRIKQPFRSHLRLEQLELLGWLGRYRAPQNPGELDWQRYQRFRGQLCWLTVESGATIQSLAPAATSGPGLLAKLRGHFSSVLSDEDFSIESNSVLKAMVLGERDPAFRRLDLAFQKTGLFHFLCVSGLHLAILAGFIWLLGLLVRLPRRTAALVVMFAIIFYALLVPARAPIIRATVAVCLLCLAEITGRESRRLHTLSLAALVVLLWRPAEIFNIGFQLSFITVAALVVLCPRLVQLFLGETMTAWTRDPGMYRRPQVQQLGQYIWLWFLRLTSTCLVAWFVCAPLLVYYFGWFNPWSPLYSLLLAPLAVATLFTGYLTTVLGSLFPILAEGLRAISLNLAELFYRAAAQLARIPGIIQHLPAPHLLLLIAFYAWLILVALRPRLRWRFERFALSRAWMIPPLLAILAGYFWWAGPLKPADTLALHLLSVGNGHASILELPNGATLAYDAGSMTAANLTDRTIMPFLRTKHLRRLDGMVISHPNWDHYSGAAELITATKIPTLMVSPYVHDDPRRKDLSKLLGTEAVPTIIASPAELLGTGRARIEILWPPKSASALRLSSNDSSLVLRITYAGRRILLTGDISTTAQRLLLSGNIDLQADVLVWPHHGAVVDTTRSFFEAVDPEIVLVSCNDRRAQQIAKQRQAPPLSGRQYYTTAQNGALTTLLRPDGIEVLPFHNGF